MAGSTVSMNEDTDRLFEVRLGPSPGPGAWSLRVLPLEPWTEQQRDAWLATIAEAFLDLAAVGGLCGAQGDPLAESFTEGVEIVAIDDAIEWRFVAPGVDTGCASLLLNLCDWAALHVAPAALVEVRGEGLKSGAEPSMRPLPERASRLGFVVEESGQTGESLIVHTEFKRDLRATDIDRISHLLLPWYTALLRGGFAHPALATGASEVRLAAPPLVIVGDLWCADFEVFTARYNAVDVYLNCLARVNHTICGIHCVSIE